MEGVQQGMSSRWKLITSGVIWYCTFTLGLSVGFLPPSLVELSEKFETDISTISKVFTVITFFFLVGAIISGIVFNYVNRQIASSILLIIMGIGTILLPLVPSLPIFFCMAAIVGFGAAGYDTAQIVWIIEMWERNAAAYIQTQHFSYALGTFVSPLLMKFFLPDEAKDIKIEKKIFLQSNISNNEFLLDNDTLVYNLRATNRNEILEDSTTKLYIPFIIGGVASIFGGILIIFLYWIKKYEKPNKVSTITKTSGDDDSGDRESDSDGNGSGGLAKSCNTQKVFLILLSAIVLGSYQGMELCSSQFMPTFTRFIKLGLSQQDGALVLSGLGGAFTIGRAIGIVLVFKILPEYLLLGNIILIILGNTLLLSFANTSLPALWGGVILLGIGFSTVFPSFYGFIEKHLKVSNVVGAIMIVAGGLVSSLYPIVIGTFIEERPFILMYTNYVSLITCTTAFIVIYCVTRKEGRQRSSTMVSISMDEKKN